MTCSTWTDPAFLGGLVSEGLILRVERFAIHDGPGIRTTVFLKGCPLRCAWCHSPESQLPRPEFMPLPDRCVRCLGCTGVCPQHTLQPAADAAIVTPDECETCGACAQACPTGARALVGRAMGVDALMAEIERDRIFYDESGGGVTFSGGEPLMQPAFLLDMVRSCGASGIHVAVDTCGHVETATLLEVARDTDLFLFDVKMIDEDRHRAFTGASNVLILQNLERLAAVHPRVVVRFPLVPGINDDDENVLAIGAFVVALRLTRIDVLPYHRTGIAKYDRLRRPYELAHVEPPPGDRLAHVGRLLEGFGLVVRPGGTS